MLTKVKMSKFQDEIGFPLKIRWDFQDERFNKETQFFLILNYFAAFSYQKSIFHTF